MSWLWIPVVAVALYALLYDGIGTAIALAIVLGGAVGAVWLTDRMGRRQKK